MENNRLLPGTDGDKRKKRGEKRRYTARRWGASSQRSLKCGIKAYRGPGCTGLASLSRLTARRVAQLAESGVGRSHRLRQQLPARQRNLKVSYFRERLPPSPKPRWCPGCTVSLHSHSSLPEDEPQVEQDPCQSCFLGFLGNRRYGNSFFKSLNTPDTGQLVSEDMEGGGRFLFFSLEDKETEAELKES